MRIVVDMQGAQSESRFRGIGRYTLEMTQALVRNKGEHEIIIALSYRFQDTIEPLRRAFAPFLPAENIRIWDAPGPLHDSDPANSARRDAAAMIREAFVASLVPDILYIPSLFEGYIDDAVLTACAGSRQTMVCVTIHDLIPLLNPEHYLKQDAVFAGFYEHKVAQLKQADFFLAISASSRDEAISALDIDTEKIVNVSEGVDPGFRRKNIDSRARNDLLQRLGITRPFLFYTGGVDQRKNLPALLQAFGSLPEKLKDQHQLVLAGKMSDTELGLLRETAEEAGILPSQIVFAGFVCDDDLVSLYNLCTLFVFPSIHEGFGLPALEAMACGAAVIASAATSLPEVIGYRDEALFNPHDPDAISAKIEEVLTDTPLRKKLQQQGLRQARRFSWDKSATHALQLFEEMISAREFEQADNLWIEDSVRPTLAFVSPMPPERTGIADYSAELIPALSRYYTISVITPQSERSGDWCENCAAVEDVAWFEKHAHTFDRVVYQLGNSPFHSHMLELMQHIPGSVVLHDFYLSSLLQWQQHCDPHSNSWSKALYTDHGYKALCECAVDPEQARLTYPANHTVLRHAQGVIVHSAYARELAISWYGNDAARLWRTIPLLREPAPSDAEGARAQLGFTSSDFIVCTFGHLDETKLNHLLLQAWLSSTLADEAWCHLVFVGAAPEGAYADKLRTMMETAGGKERITITGFLPSETYRRYLQAADVAVQLRTNSRGETSAAALDCMNHALPLIVNANGSMAEFDRNAVWMLPDRFEIQALTQALETLQVDPDKRGELGTKAQQIIHAQHAPATCAREYSKALEGFYLNPPHPLPPLVENLAKHLDPPPDTDACVCLAESISISLPATNPARRIFLDITATCRTTRITGIERVARALMYEFVRNTPAGYRIEPVYLDCSKSTWCYRYARAFTCDFLGCPPSGLPDDIVEPCAGDILQCLDLSGNALVEAHNEGLFKHWHNLGVAKHALVFDLLPVLQPEVFPPHAAQAHLAWLQAVSTFDVLTCISRSVAAELQQWQEENHAHSRIEWFHLGADFGTIPSCAGGDSQLQETLSQIKGQPSFLMVGTIEPRKAYLQTLEAFSILWEEGAQVNLVIVGSEGWKDLPEDARRDIPETIARIRAHPQLKRHLFWLEGLDDAALEQVYATSTCLLAASYGEGFGLPLIEAARRDLPLVVRNIPVFREVAGEHAYYFPATRSPARLAQTLRDWLECYRAATHPRPGSVPSLSWRESAAMLGETLTRRI